MDIKDTEVDFKIHDAYVAFSSEIVRIALLSPLVFPFFAAFAGKDPDVKAVAAVFAPAHCSLSLGLICMAVAVFFGSLHRYFAVDFMSDYIEMERKKPQIAELIKAQITTLTDEQIAKLTSKLIATLTKAQIAALTNKQIDALTNEQIDALTNEQIDALTKEQIVVITNELNILKVAAKIAKLDKSCKWDLDISTLTIIAAPIFLLFGAGFLFNAVFQILMGV